MKGYELGKRIKDRLYTILPAIIVSIIFHYGMVIGLCYTIAYYPEPRTILTVGLIYIALNVMHLIFFFLMIHQLIIMDD